MEQTARIDSFLATVDPRRPETRIDLSRHEEERRIDPIYLRNIKQTRPIVDRSQIIGVGVKNDSRLRSPQQQLALRDRQQADQNLEKNAQRSTRLQQPLQSMSICATQQNNQLDGAPPSPQYLLYDRRSQVFVRPQDVFQVEPPQNPEPEVKQSQRRQPRAVIQSFANSGVELEPSPLPVHDPIHQTIASLPAGPKRVLSESLNAVSSPQPSYQLPQPEMALPYATTTSRFATMTTLHPPTRKLEPGRDEDLTIGELQVKRAPQPSSDQVQSRLGSTQRPVVSKLSESSGLMHKTAQQLHTSYQRAVGVSKDAVSQSKFSYTYKPVYDVQPVRPRLVVEPRLSTHLLDDRWDPQYGREDIKQRAAYYRERERLEKQRQQEELRREEARLQSARQERQKLELEILSLRDAVRQEQALGQQQQKVFAARRDYDVVQQAHQAALNQRDAAVEEAYDTVQMMAAEARLAEIRAENERLQQVYSLEFEAPSVVSDDGHYQPPPCPTTAEELIMQYPDWELLPRDAQTVIGAFTERISGALDVARLQKYLQTMRNIFAGFQTLHLSKDQACQAIDATVQNVGARMKIHEILAGLRSNAVSPATLVVMMAWACGE